MTQSELDAELLKLFHQLPLKDKEALTELARMWASLIHKRRHHDKKGH